ncbi:hypothetical protein SAMN04488009_2923 [Maribacter sedimenticola]|uniref:Uncharacterized protein n=1 Tax=Maribacter sedimenticola TaxID=228956 RepID=A0ABY1SKB8_9FLAO|nr:hypothetical protein [Maribacter sedimenticola]SNR64330.1 hypothetical protein SAMN04488009_2923 [Maribacter sedimenticola]
MASNKKGGLNSFISSIIFILIIPAAPIFIEFIAEELEVKSLFLFASVYPITVCVSSRNSGVFSMAILLSLLFGFLYSIDEKLEITQGLISAAYYSIIGTCLVHIIERLKYHIIDGNAFFKF